MNFKEGLSARDRALCWLGYVYCRPERVILVAVRVEFTREGRRNLSESSGDAMAVIAAKKKHRARGISTPKMKARLIM